jgi:hypothetical protein
VAVAAPATALEHAGVDSETEIARQLGFADARAMRRSLPS